MTFIRPNEIESLRREMSRFLEGERSASPARGAAPNERENSGARSWSPAVDVTETENEITLHAELPGMKKEEIDIQLTGDTLCLRGERAREQTQRSENYHRIERQYGTFSRTFQIETPIDATGVAASYENGVLTVRLPKQAAARPRQIEIKTA